MRVGVLGGTFDPIHLGHLILAEQAREALRLQQLLFVPASQPWRKGDRAITPAHHRLNMVRLALADTPFETSTLEMDREGPCYTVDTLEQLRHGLRPASLMFFILGYDALQDLPNWHEPQRIVALATLAVAPRPGVNADDLAALEKLLPGLSARIVWLPMPRIDISASDIRERLRASRSIRYLVPGPVEAYIREQGLYRG